MSARTAHGGKAHGATASRAASPPSSGPRGGGRPPLDPFKQRALAARRRRLQVRLAAAAALVILLALGWVIWASPVFGVHSIAVQGVSGSDAAAVRARVGVAAGTPLARVDTGAVAARVDGLPMVSEAKAERSWPNTLTIKVAPRVAALVIKNPHGQLEVVDRSGVSFGTVSSAPSGIPLATATGASGMTSGAVRAALGPLTALRPALAHQVTDIKVTSADLVTFTLGHVSVVWGGSANGAQKARIVEILLRSKPTLIDVSAPNSPVTK